MDSSEHPDALFAASIPCAPALSLPKYPEDALDAPAVDMALRLNSFLLLNRTPLEAHSQQASILCSGPCSPPPISAIPCWVSGECWDNPTSKARSFERGHRVDEFSE